MQEGLFSRQVTSMANLGALSASLAGYTSLLTTFSRYVHHLPLFPLLRRLHSKLYPELCVTVPQYPSSTYDQPANELYSAVETYLSSFGTRTADNLSATVAKDGSIKLGIDKFEEDVDGFHCVREKTWSVRRWRGPVGKSVGTASDSFVGTGNSCSTTTSGM